MKTLAALLLCACAAAPAASAQPSNLGEVAFANSCTAAAQPPFARGLALLHDFEYEDAADAFRHAQAADPVCAIAFWGEAMTDNHPVWMDQDAAAARAVLARLGATPSARAAHAGTPREAAYLHAVETLYGTGGKNDRDLRYADEMAALHARYPDDVDATAFTALALLGTSHGGRDIATYMKAAALLEDVFPAHPHHPGVLHYMIHSYDDPAHAPLGMRAARLYGAIAGGAPHAVHMTSHIFIALGMWDGVISANDAAIHAVNARAPAGAPLFACGHYPQWLVYGYLQERRFTDAAAAIGRCRARAAAQLAKLPQPAFPDKSAVTSYADMAMRQSVENGKWSGADALTLAPAAFVEARFLQDYAATLASRTDKSALHGNLAWLRDGFARLQKQYGAEPDAQQDLQYWSVMLEQANALGMAANGDMTAAIAALRQAARHETTIPTEFGPPAVPKPPYELLGDLLLQAGRAQDAAIAYQAALVRAPGRTRSLQGLLDAQRVLGETDKAGATQALLGKYVKS